MQDVSDEWSCPSEAGTYMRTVQRDNEQEWDGPRIVEVAPTHTRSDLITVFCQGNSTARSQAAKYCGAHGVCYRRPGGEREHAWADGAPPLLPPVYECADLEDVGYGCPWWNPLAALTVLKSILTLWWFGITGASWTWVRLGAINVAGPRDVAQYICAVRACITENPRKRLVLFGCSRGAATVLVALRHLSAQERAHIALVLVEAPFDSLPNVFCAWWGVWFGKLAMRLFAWATQWRETQETPLQAVAHPGFPLDLPLAFVMSRTDATVPMHCTQALVRELVARNHRALRTLVLESAHHSEMPYACDPYMAFVNALYDEVLQ